jgi:hypothetical protein
MITLNIFGTKFSFTYLGEFLCNYKDIFLLGSYRFKTKSKKPFIVDCGSHIGISVFYFKKLYPNSQILSFEANPLVFKILQKNIKQNNIGDIKMINAVVGEADGSTNFYVANSNVKHSLGDSAVKNFWYNSKNYTTMTVASKRLSSYITKHVDLLNLDIEGSEGVVLKEIEDKLFLINEIYLEYHGNSGNKKNKLNDILALLKRNKFQYIIYYPQTLLCPFRRPLELNRIEKLNQSFLIINAKRVKQ